MATNQLSNFQGATRSYMLSFVSLYGNPQSRIAQLKDTSQSCLNSAVGLPPELLAHIFSHLDIRNRFAVSEVCHRWRTAALGFARLWADIGDFGDASPRLILAIDRASSLPVRLGFHLRGADEYQRETILSSVGRHLPRILTLDITLHDADAASLLRLFDALSYPAPTLRQLSITAAAGFFTGTSVLPENLFSGFAPHLKQLALGNIFLPHIPLAALSTVAFFRITATERTPLNRMAHSVLPSLEEYELDLPEGSVILPSPLNGDASAPNLRILRLNESFHLVRRYPYNMCPRIALVNPYWRHSEAAWDPATRTPAVRFAILSSFSGGSNDDGFYRLSHGVHGHNHTSYLLRRSTHHLRALVLETIAWQHDMAEPGLPQEFPQLAYLHIIIPSRDGYTAHRPPLPLWLRTPALRVLRVSVIPPHTVHTDTAVWQDRGVDAFLASLKPQPEGRAVHLETEGFPLDAPMPFVTPPYAPRAVSPEVPLYRFQQDRVDRFAHWDDWLVDLLDHVPDV